MPEFVARVAPAVARPAAALAVATLLAIGFTAEERLVAVFAVVAGRADFVAVVREAAFGAATFAAAALEPTAFEAAAFETEAFAVPATVRVVAFFVVVLVVPAALVSVGVSAEVRVAADRAVALLVADPFTAILAGVRFAVGLFAAAPTVVAMARFTAAAVPAAPALAVAFFAGLALAVVRLAVPALVSLVLAIVTVAVLALAVPALAVPALAVPALAVPALAVEFLTIGLSGPVPELLDAVPAEVTPGRVATDLVEAFLATAMVMSSLRMTAGSSPRGDWRKTPAWTQGSHPGPS